MLNPIVSDTGQLRIAFQPARMVAEVSLAILAAALRVALASRTALVGIDLEANLRAQRQHQNISGPVALRMPDERVIPCGGRGAPEHNVADAVGCISLRASLVITGRIKIYQALVTICPL